MAGLVLKNIYKTYKNDVTAVKDFSMEIKMANLLFLLDHQVAENQQF